MTSIGRALVSGALGVAMMAVPLIATAEIYRYDDETGNRHAVGDLSQVPPQFREAAISDLRARQGHGTVSRAQPNENASARPAALQGTSNAADPAAETTRIGGHERYWWQSQMQSRQQKIEDLQREIETAKAEEAHYSGKIYHKPGSGKNAGPAQRRNLRRAAVLSNSSGDSEDGPSVEQLEAELANLERDLGRFETRARQSSVPPGWLR